MIHTDTNTVNAGFFPFNTCHTAADLSEVDLSKASLPVILIVEDEAILAKILLDKLTFLGYNTPVMVRSGEEAVHFASEHHPDVVLMDIELNGQLDGIEAARQIREMSEIPVIFMGAFSDVDTVQRAFLTIKAGYLVKPVQLETLSKVIENALNR